jgi:hypothetical protein
MLSLEGGRNLNEPAVIEVLTDAARRNDVTFFRKLGRLLSKPPLSDKEVLKRTSNLERLLLSNWWHKDTPELSLCYYSDPALLKFLRDFLGIKVSHESLEQAWRRLGLTKAKPILFRGVQITRGKVFPIPVIKFRQKTVR